MGLTSESSVRNALDAGNERDARNDQPGEPVVVGHEQISPCRGNASQLDRVGWPNAFPTSNVSIPLGCVQAEDNQFHGTTREQVEVTPFEHGVVQLFWLGDYLADRKVACQQLIATGQHPSTEFDYAR